MWHSEKNVPLYGRSKIYKISSLSLRGFMKNNDENEQDCPLENLATRSNYVQHFAH